MSELDYQSFAYGVVFCLLTICAVIVCDHAISSWRTRRELRKLLERTGTPLYLDENGDLCGDGLPQDDAAFYAGHPHLRKPDGRDLTDETKLQYRSSREG